MNASRLSIHKKLIIMTALTALGITAFLLFFYTSFSSSLYREKEAQSKHISEVGIGIIQHFHDLAQTGDLSPEDAQQLAMNTLESATYRENGYFWINSGEGVLLMQPYTPERVGINQIDWTDVNGKYIFREFAKVAKEGGGWVEYYWPKPHREKEYPKISYVAYFEPWNWVLGTGVYLDDMKSNVFWSVFKASGILFASFVFFITIAFLIANVFIHQLGELAIRDTLTNLYTKRFYREILPSIVSKQQRDDEQHLAAIFIDIDHFKKVNDTYGHDYGDKVLRRIAKVITDNSRFEDFCFRFGGEEFVIIGSFDDDESIRTCAERIRTETSQLIFIDKNNEFHVTVSAGIAQYQESDDTFDETLCRADEKLYQAKEAGRNCVVM